MGTLHDRKAPRGSKSSPQKKKEKEKMQGLKKGSYEIEREKKTQHGDSPSSISPALDRKRLVAASARRVIWLGSILPHMTPPPPSP